MGGEGVKAGAREEGQGGGPERRFKSFVCENPPFSKDSKSPVRSLKVFFFFSYLLKCLV